MEPTDLSVFTDAELSERYRALLHAIQCGVKYDQETGSDDGSPKHLRTGINSALVNDAAMTRLLIAKGVITEREYLEAVVAEAQREKDRYEALLTKKLGAPVRLH